MERESLYSKRLRVPGRSKRALGSRTVRGQHQIVVNNITIQCALPFRQGCSLHRTDPQDTGKNLRTSCHSSSTPQKQNAPWKRLTGRRPTAKLPDCCRVQRVSVNLTHVFLRCQLVLFPQELVVREPPRNILKSVLGTTSGAKEEERRQADGGTGSKRGDRALSS